MSKIKKVVNSYAFNITVIVGIALLVLWLTLKDNPTDILETLKNANYFWLITALLMMLVIRSLVGVVLTIECRLSCPKYSYWKGIINSFVGSFFNNITPSASGGQFVQVYIFKKQGVPISSSAGVLWMDFIIYQTTMVISVFLLLVLRLPFFYAEYSQFFIIVAFAFVVNATVILGLWALVRFPKFYIWLTTKGIELGHKLKLVKDKEKSLNSINKQLDRFAKEVTILREHKEIIPKVVGINLLRLTLYYSIPFFIALALKIDVQFSMILDILALSSFVSLVNAFIPSPGSSGGTEATFLLMFSTIFGKVNASSIMIVWRFTTYYFMLVVGGLFFLYAKTRKDEPISLEEPKE